MIALIHAPDPGFVREASKRGVFAYITDADGDGEEWQSSIDIVLRRFAEFHELEGAFGRRAVTEQAKGILMERHSIDSATAFEMLRDHSRDANRKLFDIAVAVVDGHRLLPKSDEPSRGPASSGPALPRCVDLMALRCASYRRAYGGRVVEDSHGIVPATPDRSGAGKRRLPLKRTWRARPRAAGRQQRPSGRET